MESDAILPPKNQTHIKISSDYNGIQSNRESYQNDYFDLLKGCVFFFVGAIPFSRSHGMVEDMAPITIIEQSIF